MGEKWMVGVNSNVVTDFPINNRFNMFQDNCSVSIPDRFYWKVKIVHKYILCRNYHLCKQKSFKKVNLNTHQLEKFNISKSKGCQIWVPLVQLNT